MLPSAASSKTHSLDIGYVFRNPALLEQALTHASYAHENGTQDNETLALLGDALVNAVFTWKLYQQTPKASPGVLTERRKSLVSQAALAETAERMKLDSFLRVGKGERYKSPRMLADVFESLVGSLFLDGGLPAAVSFLERVFHAFEGNERASD